MTNTSIQTDFSAFSELSDSATIRFCSLKGVDSPAQLEPLIAVVQELLNQWQTQGKIRAGAVDILLQNTFLAVAYEPTSGDISGCTKDSLTHVLQDFEKRLSISILNSPRFSVLTGGGVVHLTMKEFRESRSAGKITEETNVFDHLIQTLGQARNRGFQTTVKNSWYAPVGA